MMKKFITLSFFVSSFVLYGAKAQTLVAHYMVTQEIIGGGGPLQGKTIATLESTGYLYRDGARYLYYEKPGYLDKYPNGSINIQVDDSNSSIYSLCTDSLQYINFINTDSLISVFRPHVNGNNDQKFNYRREYDADYFTWNVLPETKMISGLKCQKATMSIRNKLQWVIWFTPKVHMECGINGTIGVPGLIVEADFPPINTKYTLIDFSESSNINPAVFKLAELKEPYILRPPLRKANGIPAAKSKIFKQAELTNQ